MKISHYTVNVLRDKNIVARGDLCRNYSTQIVYYLSEVEVVVLDRMCDLFDSGCVLAGTVSIFANL